MTLFEIFLTQAGSGFPTLLAHALRLSPEATREGLAVAVPLVVRQLAQQTGSEDGAASLSKALEGHDGAVFLDLPGLVARKGPGAFAAELRLVPTAAQALTELVQATGWSKPQARRLLGITAALVLGMLGARQRQDGFGGAGLRRLLAGWEAMAENGFS